MKPSAQRFETYPGLESFRDNDTSRKLYAGREMEKQALFDLMIGEPLVVLFSRSGLGKSSLINAGLMQPLRERGFFPVVARLTLLPQPVASVILAIRMEAKRQGITITGGDESSLWQFLDTTRFIREGTASKLVLILDQFEELFTRVRESIPEAEQPFIDDLANVVRRRLPDDVRTAKAKELEEIEEAIEHGRADAASLQSRQKALVHLLYESTGPDVKVLLAIREDYLPDLERLREPMPAVFHKMMRLDPLTPEQARDAIELPAARKDIPGKEPFHFEEAAVVEILEFLKKRTTGRRVASIDPGQLQLICQNVDARRKGTEITAKQLGGEKGMQRILKNFYDDTLSLIPTIRLWRNSQGMRPTRTNFILLNRPRGAARRLCERGLITRSGHRDSIMRETIHSRYGVVDQDLERLEQKKLVRSTTRLERDFFELSHDTLVKPVQASAAGRRYGYYVMAYLLVCMIPFGIYEYSSSLKANLARQAATQRRVRSMEVTEQIRHGKDLSGQNLSGLNLGGITAVNGRALNASLNDTSFIAGTLWGFDFNGSDVARSNFTGATLADCKLSVHGESAKFVSSKILTSSMAGASIPRADFTGAELASVNFTGAVLDSAKFVNTALSDVRFSDTSIKGAEFTGTRWWMAVGWTPQQIQDLVRAYPPADFSSSPQYRNQLRDLMSDSESSDSYNRRAWFRATCGAELDAALVDVNKSLDQKESASSLDTRAYILLQRGDVKGALADSKKAVSLRRNHFVNPLWLGEDLYHLALAEAAAGLPKSARAHFLESKVSGYQPTYELVLTPVSAPPSNIVALAIE